MENDQERQGSDYYKSSQYVPLGERVKQDEEGTQDGGGRVVSRGTTEFRFLGRSYLDICSIIIP